jgi:hypothetical protein
MIREGQDRGEITTSADNQYNAGSKLAPADLGITKKQSHTFKKVAAIDEVEFDRQIDKMKKEQVEISRNKLIRVVDEVMQNKSPILKPKDRKIPGIIEIGHDDPEIRLLQNLINAAKNRNHQELVTHMKNLLSAKIKNYEQSRKNA